MVVAGVTGCLLGVSRGEEVHLTAIMVELILATTFLPMLLEEEEQVQQGRTVMLAVTLLLAG